MDKKELSIDLVGLSARAGNALHRAGIHTVGDMLKVSEESLTGIRNLGEKSIKEILAKIEECNKPDWPPRSAEETEETSKDFDAWINEDAGKEFVLSWLREVKIDVLELLPARAYNVLAFYGYECMAQIAFLTEEELTQIPHMDAASAGEIVKLCRHYLRDNHAAILSAYTEAAAAPKEEPAITIFDMRSMPEYHDAILTFARSNDKDIRQIGLGTRAVNRMLLQGKNRLSDIIFMTRAELQEIPAMGASSVEDVMSKINDYLSEHEARLMAVCSGDESALIDDAAIRDMILKTYQPLGFNGLSLDEMIQRLHLPESVGRERLKKNIGSLLASNELEYVDFRCYRVYDSFAAYLATCDAINDRSRDIIRKRLEGITLEGIAADYDLTRERVRQIIKRDVQKVRDWYTKKTGKTWFDEDYFRYFYETYDFEKKDGIEWFGMSADICGYLDMMDVKRGRKSLQSALEDRHNLDAGLRLKIKNYLNRNKLFVDGIWVEKRRADLEELVVRKFCTEDVSFSDFAQLYNDFLRREDIAYDEDIYYTEAICRTRKNYLSDARYLLWKQSEQIRYYDIAGRDFTELLDTLNLEAYENIEISTLKFMEDYPDIMAKYDIRDQYELHNLLRKIVPEGSYHDFRCGRMPEIKFGAFDRDAAILDILADNAPISLQALCDLIHAEYGYDPAVIRGTYLQPFDAYYHQGMYVIDHKVMPIERRNALKAALTEDFYYIDEVRRIYRGLFPDADLEEINSYNLKTMGLLVLSKYVVQNHPSLDAFCESILTRDDIFDLTPYKKRFVYVQAFSQKLMELKRNLRIIEFEPNQIINFRKIERGGVTREMIQDFCDAVYEFVEDGAYFSVQSIRQSGFESELFALGFSDWFYANLLISDDRFSFGTMFGNIILYKGHESITIKSFEMDRIKEYGSIDTYDLVAELTDRFGCKIPDRLDVLYKVQGTEIYYDKILDRLYASADIYYRELDETEAF